MVGRDISSSCHPKSIKMTQGNKNGTLILSVERGNEINIEYSKKEIIDKINSYFGYQLINEVRLESFNSQNTNVRKKNKSNQFFQDFEKKINEIKSEDIKNSLSELLNAIKND